MTPKSPCSVFVICISIPFLSGERAPYWDAELRGAYLGIADYHNRIHFARALMEGICYDMKEILDAVKDLLDHVLGKMESRIDTYLDGTSALITVATEDIEDRIDLLDNRIDSFETRLSTREQALRLQYYELQEQLLNMQYGFQQSQAAMGSLNMYG